MLGNLLKKLKTENNISKCETKQEVYNSQKSNNNTRQLDCNSNEAAMQTTIKYNMDSYLLQLWETNNFHIQLPFSRVRYFTLDNLPSMAQLVRNCKLSLFHELKHSKRKVKEIKLSRTDLINTKNRQQQSNTYPLPEYLKFLECLLIKQLPRYNHILINDYPSGIGILNHTDGPMYNNRVIVLSLQGYAILNFTHSPSMNKCEEPQSQTHLKYGFNYKPYKILLQPNSIHIFEKEAYSQYLHGINTDTDYDCMMLAYDQQTDSIVKSDVANYSNLASRQQIQTQIRRLMLDNIINQNTAIKVQKIDTPIINHKITQQFNESINNMADQQNNTQYNMQVLIRRNNRISITIREQYSHAQQH